jgi:hypothetical protein
MAAGMPLFLFGVLYGGYNWIEHALAGTQTPTGTIMLATASLLVGMQFLLSFFAADVAAVPRYPIHTLLDHQVLQPLKQFGIQLSRSTVDVREDS